MDDFGSGYASLNIDPDFVGHIATDKKDIAITGAIINLAHHLNMKVVDKGVQTEEQRQGLTSLGCDSLQGTLIGEATPSRTDQIVIGFLLKNFR